MKSLQTDAPATLHHLHITSEEPERLAEFYRQFLGMTLRNEGDTFVLHGGTRSVLISRGPSASLACACYATADSVALDRLCSHLTENKVPVVPYNSPFFENAIAVTDPQGRRIAFGVPKVPRAPDGVPARLQHTVFQTTELESIVRFYVEKVGFTISDEVVDDEGRPTVVFLRSDDEHHSLAFFRGSRNEWDHHCYETNEWNDIRDWGDKFAKARIPIFFGPGRHGPGNNLFFMVTDSDGNRLEFSAEIDRVSPESSPGVWPHDEYTLNSWGRAWIRS